MDEKNKWPIPEVIGRARAIKTLRLSQFRPTDAECYQRTSSGEVLNSEPEIIKNGWDHEHCLLCLAEISLYPGCEASGYADENEDNWLCIACYEKYIAPNPKRVS